MNGFLKNAIGMLAAGVLASGLVLAAWALSPKPEPGSEQSHGHGAGEELRPEQLLGRWSFVDAKNQKAFVEFTEFGSWFGSDGCNGMSGLWGEQDDALQMHPTGAMTQIGCDNAPVPSGEISGSSNAEGELELLVETETGDGGHRIGLKRVGDGTASLTGVTWTPEWIDGSSASSDVKSEITFADDGTWSGTDGCNLLNGTWSWKPDPDNAGIDGFGAVLQLDEFEFVTKQVLCEKASSFPSDLVRPHWFSLLSEDSVLMTSSRSADEPQNGIFLRRVEPEARG